MFSTAILGLHLLIIHSVLSAYYASTHPSKHSIDSFILGGLLALLFCNYVKLYALSIFHANLIIDSSPVLTLTLLGMCILIQICLAIYKRTRFTIEMLVTTLILVGYITFVALSVN